MMSFSVEHINVGNIYFVLDDVVVTIKMFFLNVLNYFRSNGLKDKGDDSS